jgi:hypothetical protein
MSVRRNLVWDAFWGLDGGGFLNAISVTSLEMEEAGEGGGGRESRGDSCSVGGGGGAGWFREGVSGNEVRGRGVKTYHAGSGTIRSTKRFRGTFSFSSPSSSSAFSSSSSWISAAWQRSNGAKAFPFDYYGLPFVVRLLPPEVSGLTNISLTSLASFNEQNAAQADVGTAFRDLPRPGTNIAGVYVCFLHACMCVCIPGCHSACIDVNATCIDFALALATAVM